jgi:hypothetical protein
LFRASESLPSSLLQEVRPRQWSTAKLEAAIWRPLFFAQPHAYTTLQQSHLAETIETNMQAKKNQPEGWFF